jgi:hypothetical protein
MKNQHGLSRHIPNEVKAAVRRLSKFGCVRCRNAIYQYEHIDPEFAEARSHDPHAICLLCASCHDRVTRGQISKISVKQAYAKTQTDNAIKPPWSDFDLSGQQGELMIGASTFYSPTEIFCVNGETLLAFASPEEPGTPPLLSGSFYNSKGDKIIEIDRNEWVLPSVMADCEVQGRHLRIASDADQIDLALEMCPPNKLRIHAMNMFKDGAVIKTLEDLVGVFLWRDGKQGPGVAVAFDCWQPKTCVVVDASKVDRPCRNVKIIGGEGICVEGPDIWLGAGSGKALIRRIAAWH